MPPKANTLSSMPSELIKRIVEEAGKKEPRRPLTTDIPKNIDPNVYRYIIENGYDISPQDYEHTEAERGRILKDAVEYINRKYHTPPKYNAASTSKQINNDIKPKAKAKPKPRAKVAPKLQPTPKPKPKARAKSL